MFHGFTLVMTSSLPLVGVGIPRHVKADLNGMTKNWSVTVGTCGNATKTMSIWNGSDSLVKITAANQPHFFSITSMPVYDQKAVKNLEPTSHREESINNHSFNFKEIRNVKTFLIHWVSSS